MGVENGEKMMKFLQLMKLNKDDIKILKYFSTVFSQFKRWKSMKK